MASLLSDEFLEIKKIGILNENLILIIALPLQAIAAEESQSSQRSLARRSSTSIHQRSSTTREAQPASISQRTSTPSRPPTRAPPRASLTSTTLPLRCIQWNVSDPTTLRESEESLLKRVSWRESPEESIGQASLNYPAFFGHWCWT